MLRGLFVRTVLTVTCVAICGVAFAARKPESERAEIEGFVIARFASNGGNVYQLLRVQELSEGSRNSTLRGPGSAASGTSPVVYSGWLPPGRYRIRQLETVDSMYTPGARADLEDLLPPFTVEAGRLTDLGTLIEQPVAQGVATFVQWNDPAGFDPEHYSWFPFVASALDPDPIRWNGTADWTYKEAVAYRLGPGGLIGAIAERLVRGPNVRSLQKQWSESSSAEQLLSTIKQATLALTRPVFDRDGNAYFGSNLGQVLRRSTEGEWRNLDTRTIDEIAAVLIEGSNIFASTVQRRLLSSSDHGATWTAAPVRLPGQPTSMERLPSGVFLIATAGTPDMDAAIFRSDDFRSFPAEPWKRLELGKRMKRFPSRRAMLALSGDRLIAWVHYKASFAYDVEAETWTDAESDFDLGELLVNDTAGLSYSAGPFRNGGLSANGGRSWSRTSFSARPVAVGFRDPTNGIALVAEGGVMVSAEHFVETTADGGETWKRVGAPPSPCRAARYLPPTDELVCVGFDGEIQSSRTGVEWTLERVVY